MLEWVAVDAEYHHAVDDEETQIDQAMARNRKDVCLAYSPVPLLCPPAMNGINVLWRIDPG